MQNFLASLSSQGGWPLLRVATERDHCIFTHAKPHVTLVIKWTSNSSLVQHIYLALCNQFSRDLMTTCMIILTGLIPARHASQNQGSVLADDTLLATDWDSLIPQQPVLKGKGENSVLKEIQSCNHNTKLNPCNLKYLTGSTLKAEVCISICRLICLEQYMYSDASLSGHSQQKLPSLCGHIFLCGSHNECIYFSCQDLSNMATISWQAGRPYQRGTTVHGFCPNYYIVHELPNTQ